MKTIKYLVMVAMTICLASCGEKNNSVASTDESSKENVLKPVETEVSGDMEGCFTIVDKEYKPTEDWGDGLITVEFERTDEKLPFELNGRELWTFGTSGEGNYVKVGFGVEFLDADGNVLKKMSANASGLSGPYSPEEAIQLVKLKSGRKGSMRFCTVKGAVGFRISSAFEEGEGWDSNKSSSEVSSSYDDDNDSSSSSGGSAKWDAILDSYDSYVTKYISYMKKVAKGDMNALSEYPALMEKAQEFSEKISGAHDEMSASQWARYINITNKMSTAASQMQ